MQTTQSGWTVLDTKLPILYRSYSFGPASANCIVLGMGEGKLAVLSPACRLDEGAYADLAAFGQVAALVAPNSFHHLGMNPWQARFPAAKRYAPERSLARLTKKSAPGFEPLGALQTRLAAEVAIFEPPHLKAGELMARARTESGWVWYSNDLIMNVPKLPHAFLPRMIFKVTDSGPGLKAGGFAAFLFVKDRRALYRWVIEELKKYPPSALLVGHGDMVTGAQVAERLNGALRARL